MLREKRDWTDVLYDFDDLRDDFKSGLTLVLLLSLLPPLRPRWFSIASSPREQRQQQQLQRPHSMLSLNLTVAVVNLITPLGRTYRGTCSGYLQTVVTGTDHVTL